MTYFERYNLHISPAADPWDATVNPTGWKNEVEFHLLKIESTDTGKALFGNMTKSTKKNDPTAWIELRPFLATTFEPCNAHGLRVRKALNKKMGWILSEVIFEPNKYHKGSYCYEKKGYGKPDQGRGSLADESLFHELIHGHRQIMQLRNQDKLRGALYKYTEPEEFLAVVITNIYISDITNLNSSGLRGSHRGNGTLESELSDSLAFYSASANVYPIISKFAEEEQPLFNALAKIKAAFNPLRALKENEAAVRAASRSEIAKTRDIAGEEAEQKKRIADQFLPVFGWPSREQQANNFASALAARALALLKK